MMKLSIIILLVVITNWVTVAQPSNLFEEEALIEISLSGPISELMKDRGNDSHYHPLTLTYKSSNVNPTVIPIKVKTRGHFRKLKSNCTYPPLLLNFSSETTKSTIFENQNKLKLVTACRDDKYVIREYLVYKLYSLITPKSFQVRLVRVVLEDTGSKSKSSEPFYGILIEDEDEMAKRNHAFSVDGKLVRPEQTQKDDFLMMATFEYMIGNTDWSVQYLQNVKLISTDSTALPYTVAYDFDHAGIVGAPYALPAAELMLNSTRQRRYRGYCIKDMSQFDPVIARFNQLKDEIYKVYSSNVVDDERYVKATLKYLDDFYETINNPKRLNYEFDYPCRPDGTGNVVIQGLKKN
ncbi:MAG: hypothetical protein JNM78_08820 [Cyclobacteriaceae bacterium]|nr:hypothetical protein [Cyclobacteriaceae bacterium]